MAHPDLTLAALVGSRICHDLISPVGAIHNGLELIGMGGPIDTPELRLISDSVNNASARIKFFRVAFGVASSEQMIGTSEIGKVINDSYGGGRHQADWQGVGDVPRAEVQAIYLGLLCLETALPQGGMITVSGHAGRWTLAATGPRIALDPDARAALDGALPGGLRPAHVQYALLPLCLEGLGSRLHLDQSDEALILRF
ncbi:histidine phosphotransferase family protein [Aquicoccus sp.]|uniref:histidine phosphotransferase family protein n=1 Tax=Aquicoccus sp. TaxID=2055851 RepID=UPI0035663A6D